MTAIWTIRHTQCYKGNSEAESTTGSVPETFLHEMFKVEERHRITLGRIYAGECYSASMRSSATRAQ